MNNLPIGAIVGAGRWPFDGAHPDCWGRPWKGVMLAQNDVRAWTNTLAFYGTPTQDQVDAHIVWCHGLNLLGPECVPVLWDFKSQIGEPYQKVHWETFGDGQHDVKPYEDDLRLWQQANLKARVRAGCHLKAVKAA